MTIDDVYPPSLLTKKQKDRILSEYLAFQPVPPRKPKYFLNGVPRIPRNVKCYCGSGQKYKRCHGKTEHKHLPSFDPLTHEPA